MLAALVRSGSSTVQVALSGPEHYTLRVTVVIAH
jgi:hypothetical protein